MSVITVKIVAYPKEEIIDEEDLTPDALAVAIEECVNMERRLRELLDNYEEIEPQHEQYPNM